MSDLRGNSTVKDVTVFRMVLVCAAVAVLFDVLASLLSKSTNLAYAWFVIPQAVMYVAIGLALALFGRSLKSVILAVFYAAVAEATLGRYVSALIGPGRITEWEPRGITPEVPSSIDGAILVAIVILIALCTVALGMLFGSLGALTGAMLRKKRATVRG